jgi:hypothetical protein
MHTVFKYRGRRIAVTKDGFGWHVQTRTRVVSRPLLIDALEEALPRLPRSERDRLTVVLFERATRKSGAQDSVRRSIKGPPGR